MAKTNPNAGATETKGTRGAAGTKGRAAAGAASRAAGGSSRRGTKVGSSPRAAEQFADRNDFGTPAGRAKPRGRAREAAEGRQRNEQGRSGEIGDRTHGVGTAPSNVGSGSGGDIDTDFIGVGIRPVAQDAPTGVTTGPASTTGGSEEFASGPPARGENELPAGTHGAAATRTYDTVDHTGEDVNTVQAGTNTDTAGTAMGNKGPDDAAGGTGGDEGTLTADEAADVDTADLADEADEADEADQVDRRE